MTNTSYILSCTSAGFLPQMAEIVSMLSDADAFVLDLLMIYIAVSLITINKTGDKHGHA